MQSGNRSRGESKFIFVVRCRKRRFLLHTISQHRTLLGGSIMKSKPSIGRSVVHLCIGTLVAASGLAQAASMDKSQTALGVRCSDIYKLGIDMQENLRATAIRVACGLDAPGSAGPEWLEADSV